MGRGDTFDWRWGLEGNVSHRFKVVKVIVERDIASRLPLGSPKLVTLKLEEIY